MFERMRISPDAARLVFETNNPHERSFRISVEDTTETSYYIAVSVTTMEGLTGYGQVIYRPEEVIGP